MDAYLRCGILDRGFLILSCEGCGEKLPVAFSCKRRGFYPSCCAKRMCRDFASRLLRAAGHWRDAAEIEVATDAPHDLVLAAESPDAGRSQRESRQRGELRGRVDLGQTH
jgi:hypothetical protein